MNNWIGLATNQDKESRRILQAGAEVRLGSIPNWSITATLQAVIYFSRFLIMLSLSTPQDMFSIYVKVVTLLGYPQDFSIADPLWDCGIDELAGVIAQTDSDLYTSEFLAECDCINQAIKSLGYEI